jgi:hypothetical protein
MIPTCFVCKENPAVCVHDVSTLARLALCASCAAVDPHTAVITAEDFHAFTGWPEICWCSERDLGRRVPWCPKHGEEQVR